ncbi:hypothetical protein ACJIZ3_006422 [Penstemon smallii]|uniref:YDG domain-containing protein n=1 Tax=Penstemon smallii TaxID=265156 RepID=A0ABD3S7R9_9LAMI
MVEQRSNRKMCAFCREQIPPNMAIEPCINSAIVSVTNHRDYFGPITADYDPKRNQGVLVGETWKDRMERKQWGAHLEHFGDDEDHGDWFIYTGKGNKRTCKKRTSDRKSTLHNEALCISCLHGYPVRVVRSYWEKHSSYAPQTCVRYDGIYKGFIVCRYLLIHCDNDPEPWTSPLWDYDVRSFSFDLINIISFTTHLWTVNVF